MKTIADLIVLIPVGPNTNPSYLLDTINSIDHYCRSSKKIVLVNDSGQNICLNNNESVIILSTPRIMGKQSGLYFTLTIEIKYALKHFHFKILLRMDDDALITGISPEKDADKYFNDHPKVGMLGSFRVKWNGEKRSFLPPNKLLNRELTFYWKMLKSIRYLQIVNISKLVSIAKKNGYEYGSHVLGGAYFMSFSLTKKLREQGLLGSELLRGSMLEEDHIFSLLTYVGGFELGDFVTKDFPMYLQLSGMPTSPKNIIKLKKKIIHSTRYYKDESEKQIREQFKLVRDTEINKKTEE